MEGGRGCRGLDTATLSEDPRGVPRRLRAASQPRALPVRERVCRLHGCPRGPPAPERPLGLDGHKTGQSWEESCGDVALVEGSRVPVALATAGTYPEA